MQDDHGFVVIANFSDAPVGEIEFTVPASVLGANNKTISLEPLLSHDGISLEKDDVNYSASLSLDGLETKVFAF